MQVPERLSLIGGSILLASTLVFTLKSQASHVLPQVIHPISTIYDHVNDTQKSVEFDDAFQKAAKDGQQTGSWGSSKWYIDSNDGLHVGKGDLQGTLYNAIGGNKLQSLKSVSFEGHIRAPQDSTRLLAGVSNVDSTLTPGSSNIVSIHGLDDLDTSHVTNMYAMFANDGDLKDINVASLDTHNVTEMGLMFSQDSQLSSLDVSDWNVDNVKNLGGTFSKDHALQSLDLSRWQPRPLNNLGYTFENTYSLHDLDLSNFDTTHSRYMDNMMVGSGVHDLILGAHTYLNKPVGIPGNSVWQNSNDQQIASGANLTDNNLHPGTWTWTK